MASMHIEQDAQRQDEKHGSPHHSQHVARQVPVVAARSEAISVSPVPSNYVRATTFLYVAWKFRFGHYPGGDRHWKHKRQATECVQALRQMRTGLVTTSVVWCHGPSQSREFQGQGQFSEYHEVHCSPSSSTAAVQSALGKRLAGMVRENKELTRLVNEYRTADMPAYAGESGREFHPSSACYFIFTRNSRLETAFAALLFRNHSGPSPARVAAVETGTGRFNFLYAEVPSLPS
ncbi:hypothetical protein BKA83DRAFT_4504780 [Pisolithus microcarpus]|nr:hypothetical protein BKA83DRAFT_4504780 [Pisolithus microcarpus]